MKHLVILSGKGGTGKTTVAAAFAHLAHDGAHPLRAVLADANVYASGLELMLKPHPLETHHFISGAKAIIDTELCEGCCMCEAVCHYNAVLTNKNGADIDHVIDPMACTGCGVCVYECAAGAICLQPQLAGHWYLSETRYGPLFYASLHPAQENSGRLVTLVRLQARRIANNEGYEILIMDGPAGIGNPVISAATGANLVLIVVEPTAAGMLNMERVVRVADHFRVRALVCINKADLYPEYCVQIEEFCHQRGIDMVGKIPMDPAVAAATQHSLPVTVFAPKAPASQSLQTIWQRVVDSLDGRE